MLSVRTWVRVRVARVAARFRLWFARGVVKMGQIEDAAKYDLNRVGTLRHARWETCKVCPLLTKMKTCSACHCFMPIKVDMEKAKCPKGKW